MGIYTKQTWVDNDPSKPLSAARMTVIENGVDNANTVVHLNAHGFNTANSDNGTVLAGILADTTLVPAAGATLVCDVGAYNFTTGVTPPNPAIKIIGGGAQGFAKTSSEPGTQWVWNTSTAGTLLNVNGVDGTGATLGDVAPSIHNIGFVDAPGRTANRPGTATLVKIRNCNRVTITECGFHYAYQGLMIDKSDTGSLPNDSSWNLVDRCFFGQNLWGVLADSYGTVIRDTAFAANTISLEYGVFSATLTGGLANGGFASGLRCYSGKFDANEIPTTTTATALSTDPTITVSKPQFFVGETSSTATGAAGTGRGQVLLNTRTGEQMYCTNVNYSTGVLTVTRGYNGTTAAAVNSGDQIRADVVGILLGHVDTAYLRDLFMESTVGTTINGQSKMTYGSFVDAVRIVDPAASARVWIDNLRAYDANTAISADGTKYLHLTGISHKVSTSSGTPVPPNQADPRKGGMIVVGKGSNLCDETIIHGGTSFPANGSSIPSKVIIGAQTTTVECHSVQTIIQDKNGTSRAAKVPLAFYNAGVGVYSVDRNGTVGT